LQRERRGFGLRLVVAHVATPAAQEQPSMMLPLMAIVLAQTCPAGESTGPETQGNCCWPDQVWSKARAQCVGIPRCPLGFEAQGEACRYTGRIPGAAAPQPDAPSPGIDPAQVEQWPAPPPPPSSQVDLPPPPAENAAAAPVEPKRRPLPQRLPPADHSQIDPLAAEPLRTVEPEVRAENPAAEKTFEPQRGVFNLGVYTAFDFSELVEGGVLAFDINFTRSESFVFGMTTGVGVMGCAFESSSCTGTFLFFPTALRFALRLGSVVELEFRGGGVPSLIWRKNGYSGAFLMKALIGAGLHFNTGRGGAFIGFDLLPNDGVAHVLSVGYRF
jgi:hypothetical protein